jgi:hypothetical protein
MCYTFWVWQRKQKEIIEEVKSTWENGSHFISLCSTPRRTVVDATSPSVKRKRRKRRKKRCEGKVQYWIPLLTWDSSVRLHLHSHITVLWLVLYFIFLFEYWVVGSKLCPLGTASTTVLLDLPPRVIVRMENLLERTVLAGDNRSIRWQSAPKPFYPPQIPLARPGLEPGTPCWEASD